MENKMFCYQCQETAGGKGCTLMGVCGKSPDVAAMQDLLVYVTKGLGAVATRLREEGKKVSREVNHLVTLNLFVTITNANFDRDDIISRIEKTMAVRNELVGLLTDKNEYSRMAESCNPYGDGQASRRIIQAILYHYGLADERPDVFMGSDM